MPTDTAAAGFGQIKATLSLSIAPDVTRLGVSATSNLTRSANRLNSVVAPSLPALVQTAFVPSMSAKSRVLRGAGGLVAVGMVAPSSCSRRNELADALDELGLGDGEGLGCQVDHIAVDDHIVDSPEPL